MSKPVVPSLPVFPDQAPQTFDLDGVVLSSTAGQPNDVLKEAHAHRKRLRCKCTQEGVPMYLARVGGIPDAFSIKRMPDTGDQHAPSCPSYDPPSDFSGRGQLSSSAITEDPDSGRTTLRLDIALSKAAGGRPTQVTDSEAGSVETDGARLTLRSLLHYLWDRADLTRWHPGFEGRRAWFTVRRQLVAATTDVFAGGQPLQKRIFIPETFSVEQRDAIAQRRQAQWLAVTSSVAKQRPLMLLVGEVKEILPARYGHKVVVKHLPDLPFMMDDELYRRLERRFESELALWGALQDIHLVAIATFSLMTAPVPTIAAISLMPVTQHWIPIDHAAEKQLIDQLVSEGRSFVKGLRYNLVADAPSVSATLTDTTQPVPLLLTSSELGNRSDWVPAAEAWQWNPSQEAMPALPSKHIVAT